MLWDGEAAAAPYLYPQMPTFPLSWSAEQRAAKAVLDMNINESWRGPECKGQA